MIPWGADKNRVAGYLLDRRTSGLRVFLPGTDETGRLWRWSSLTDAEITGSVLWRDVVHAESPRGLPAGLTPAAATIDVSTASAFVDVLGSLGASLTAEVVRWSGYGDAGGLSRGTPEGEYVLSTEGLSELFTRSDRLPAFVWFPELGTSIGAPLYADSLFLSGPREVLTRFGRRPELEVSGVRADEPLPLPGFE
ncbi:hypothetical protein [Leifsonia xyli]|uniref:hypothetical protein n=1 Tax=Leifsonia xyli TaxID=1575 RepID=UPI003D679FEE